MTESPSFLALVDAVRAGDVASAAELLRKHPDLANRLDDPIPQSSGAPLITPAVQAQNREMVDFLLSAGADINARSHWWAGSFGVLDLCTPDFAAFLIDRGAVVDANAAARLGMLDRLSELVAGDTSLVHARGGDGQTPLHVAGTVEIERFLLDHGADIDALDIDHESTPAQYLVRDTQDVARFLVTRGCRTDILMAVALGAIELVRKHLDHDPASLHLRVSEKTFPMRNPRAGGSIYFWTLGYGKGAHELAREFGRKDVLDLLLERGPDEPFVETR